jgi:hypothetical protein
MSITMILSIALAISMSLNAIGGWAYLGQRDATVAAESERDQARGAATACSDATEALRTLADKREAENKKLRAEAAARAQGHDKKADEILSTAASDPDDCKAAQHRGTTWLKGRK